MREFIISTESNADLPDDYVDEHGICVIPHYYSVDDDIYGDGKVLTIREFYDAMREGRPAKTMASNPAVIEERFSRYGAEGKDIIHISFSSEMSAGMSNVVVTARAVMEKHPGMQIHVIDTLSATVGEYMMVAKAVEMKESGRPLAEVKDVIEGLVPYLCMQFTVDDLNHLHRGGRLSKTQAVVGSLIDVKPILHINDGGSLAALQKTRGRKKSIHTLVANMGERLGEWRDKQIFIGIAHGDCEEDAGYLARLVREEWGYEDIVIRPIGPSIGAHTGPGALGVAFLGAQR